MHTEQPSVATLRVSRRLQRPAIGLKQGGDSTQNNASTLGVAGMTEHPTIVLAAWA